MSVVKNPEIPGIQPTNGHRRPSKFQFETLTQDFIIGFSNGYTGPDDDKWQIAMGASYGTKILWNGSELVRHQTQWEQVKNNFVVQVTDGNIGVYAADTNGIKGNLIVELNDKTIVKSDLNTLTATATANELSGGTARIRGVCGN